MFPHQTRLSPHVYQPLETWLPLEEGLTAPLLQGNHLVPPDRSETTAAGLRALSCCPFHISVEGFALQLIFCLSTPPTPKFLKP